MQPADLAEVQGGGGDTEVEVSSTLPLWAFRCRETRRWENRQRQTVDGFPHANKERYKKERPRKYELTKDSFLPLGQQSLFLLPFNSSLFFHFWSLAQKLTRKFYAYLF